MSGTDAAISRIVGLHVAVVAVPVLLVLLLAGQPILAVPVAIVVAAGVTAWRLRAIDDRIAVRIGASPVEAGHAPRVAGLAETMAMTVGVPVPRLFVIDTPAVNAVSWGFGNGPDCLAVTSGLLESADVVALEAVVGHHLASAETRRIEITTLVAALFGPIARGPVEGWVASALRADEDRSVVRADLDGVRATRFPPGMVQALEMVQAGRSGIDAVPPALRGLCFAAPADGDGPFAVHPPLDDRIDLLREL